MALALFLGAVSGAYLIDALSVSTRLNNIILLAPTASLCMALALVLALGELRLVQSTSGERERAPVPTRALGLSAALAAYVAVSPIIGLDVASVIFIATALALLGERRPLVLCGLSVAAGLLIVGGAVALIPYPLPTLLL